MHPRIAEFLTALFGTNIFYWLVPNPSIIYAAAMLAVLCVFVRRCHWSDLSREHALGMSVWAMLAGLIGTRVFYLVQHLSSTLAAPRQLLDVAGGTASWGAYLGGFAGLVLYARRQRLEVMRYADVVGSCLGLGIAIGRWSCFLNGDDFGTLSNLPWAVRFPHASIPFVAQVQAGMLDPLAQLSLPVHPVQLYLSANGLILFFVGTWVWKRWRNRPGVTFCLYVLAYCVARFLWEYFRGDQARLFNGAVTVPQLMAALTLAPAGWGLARSLRAGAGKEHLKSTSLRDTILRDTITA